MQVVAQIVGEALLPWEDEATAKAMLRSARRFRGAIMPLLHRDASCRPPIDTFMRQCSELLSASQPLQHVNLT